MTAARFNPKRDLPYIAAAAQTAQFSLAGSILLGVKGWLFGGLLGLLVSLAVAYASSQYADIAKARKPWAMAGMVILFLFSPLIVGTSMYLDLPQSLHPIWRGIVGGAWGILPDVSVAVVGFVAGRGLVKQEDKPAQVETKPTPAPRKEVIPLRKPITTIALIAELRKTPGATDEQLAQVFGVSRQAIQQRRKKLTPVDMGLAK